MTRARGSRLGASCFPTCFFSGEAWENSVLPKDRVGAGDTAGPTLQSQACPPGPGPEGSYLKIRP